MILKGNLMRRAAKRRNARRISRRNATLPSHDFRDRNEAEIVDALEMAGYKVLLVPAYIGGVPDLAIKKFGIEFRLEVKNPAANGSLTPAQVAFHQWWGDITTVENPSQALDKAEAQLARFGAI